MAGLNLDILPPAQRNLWQQLSDVPGSFVLYGDTAVALQLGHRISEDFDFFTSMSFSPDELVGRLTMFSAAKRPQYMENTLTLSVSAGNDPVKISFFGGLPLNRVQDPLQAENGVYVASLLDLFGTKCKVAMDRAIFKDYLDIVAILKNTDLTLADGLAAANAIYGDAFIPLTSLKALSYTSDLAKTLPASDLAVLHKAITDVAPDALPVLEPLGVIGDYKTSCNMPTLRLS